MNEYESSENPSRKAATWRVSANHFVKGRMDKGGFTQEQADAFSVSLVILAYKDITVYDTGDEFGVNTYFHRELTS